MFFYQFARYFKMVPLNYCIQAGSKSGGRLSTLAGSDGFLSYSFWLFGHGPARKELTTWWSKYTVYNLTQIWLLEPNEMGGPWGSLSSKWSPSFAFILICNFISDPHLDLYKK